MTDKKEHWENVYDETSAPLKSNLLLTVTKTTMG
ncbi:hypothetical protein ACVWYN_001035 [Pedobacter sp. UYP24]